MTTVEKICNRDVACVLPGTTIQAAAKLMRQNHVGTVVVVDEVAGRRFPAGILTDRDIVIGVDALDLDPKAMTAGDVMSAELVTVRENADLKQAAQIMRNKGVRRLPVIAADGSLAGILSTDDLFEALTEQMTAMSRALARERDHEIRNRK